MGIEWESNGDQLVVIKWGSNGGNKMVRMSISRVLISFGKSWRLFGEQFLVRMSNKMGSSSFDVNRYLSSRVIF